MKGGGVTRGDEREIPLKIIYSKFNPNKDILWPLSEETATVLCIPLLVEYNTEYTDGAKTYPSYSQIYKYIFCSISSFLKMGREAGRKRKKSRKK